MIVIIYLVLILSVLCYGVKLSLRPWYERIVYGFILVGFTLFMVEPTSRSSKLLLEQYLVSDTAREYVAILVTLELTMVLNYSFRNWTHNFTPLRATAWHTLREKYFNPPFRWLEQHYITLLIFPTLYLVQSRTVYALPGIRFLISAILVGGGSLILSVLLGWLIQTLLPSRSEREELLLFTSFILCAAALLSTTTGEIIYAPSRQGTDMPEGFQHLIVGGFIVLFVTGALIRRLHKFKH